MQQFREHERMAKQRESEDAKALVQQQLADKMAREQALKDERDQILLELILEEQEEADRQKEQDERERKFRQRIEMQVCALLIL